MESWASPVVGAAVPQGGEAGEFATGGPVNGEAMQTGPAALRDAERAAEVETDVPVQVRVNEDSSAAFQALRDAAHLKARKEKVFQVTRDIPFITVTDASGNPVEGLREIDLVADLPRVQRLLTAFSARAKEQRGRTSVTGLTRTEETAFKQRWDDVILRLEEDRENGSVGYGSAQVIAAFGQQTVDHELAKLGPKPLRALSRSKYYKSVRDYLYFCDQFGFRDVFLDDFSQTAATLVLVLFLQHQAEWRGPRSGDESLAALQWWFKKCARGRNVTTMEGWFSDPRVRTRARELAATIPATERLAQTLERRNDVCRGEYLWASKSVFGVLYADGSSPFADNGRRERMMCACFWLMFAYGPRPSNVCYDKKELLSQLLTVDTVYFRMRTPNGSVEVFYSFQFDQMRLQPWFTAAACLSICIIHLEGKQWGIDKPNCPRPLAYAIVQGRSAATDILKDSLFQHCDDAHHRPGDAFFSLNTTRKTAQTTRVENKKLLSKEVTLLLKTTAILLDDDPTHLTLKSIRQTVATSLARAGVADDGEAGQGYFRKYMGWLSTEAPRRYVNFQIRPVSGLDTELLTRDEVDGAKLPSSKRTLWKQLVAEDLEQRALLIEQSFASEAASRVVVGTAAPTLGSVSAPDVAVGPSPLPGGSSAVSAPETGSGGAESVTQPAWRESWELDTAYTETQRTVMEQVGGTLTEAQLTEWEDRVCQESLALLSASVTRHLGFGPALAEAHSAIDIESSEEDEAQVEEVGGVVGTPSEAAIVRGDFLMSPHTFLPIEVLDRWGVAKQWVVIAQALSELASVFMVPPGEEYELWGAREHRFPSPDWKQDWTYLTVDAVSGLPLGGSSYEVMWVMARGLPAAVHPQAQEQWDEFTKRVRASLRESPLELGAHQIELAGPNVGICAVGRTGSDFTSDEVGTLSADGGICAPGGLELISPVDVPGVPFYAVFQGVYGRVPCVTQSWVYCMALVSGWKHGTGEPMASFPPGTCFKDGFMERDQAWMFATKGRDVRTGRVATRCADPTRLERLGFLVFYGAVRRAVHPISQEEVICFITTDPTVYRTLYRRDPSFEGGVFVTYMEALLWVEGETGLEPRPSPFDLRTLDQFHEWRSQQPSVIGMRYEAGHLPIPVPGRPGEFYAGCLDQSRKRLPTFPVQEDVTSSHSGTVWSDDAAVAAYLNAAGESRNRILELISQGYLPAGGYSDGPHSWKIYSLANPMDPPEVEGLSGLERNEYYFQQLVARGLIEDRRSEGCRFPQPTAQPAGEGGVASTHLRTRVGARPSTRPAQRTRRLEKLAASEGGPSPGDVLEAGTGDQVLSGAPGHGTRRRRGRLTQWGQSTSKRGADPASTSGDLGEVLAVTAEDTPHGIASKGEAIDELVAEDEVVLNPTDQEDGGLSGTDDPTVPDVVSLSVFAETHGRDAPKGDAAQPLEPVGELPTDGSLVMEGGPRTSQLESMVGGVGRAPAVADGTLEARVNMSNPAGYHLASSPRS